MTFTCYILECSDGSFYTGHTDNLENRISQHYSGFMDNYTKLRRPLKLVWSQTFSTRYEALAAERQIKGWSRVKKKALIDEDWDALRHHAKNRQDT